MDIMIADESSNFKATNLPVEPLHVPYISHLWRNDRAKMHAQNPARLLESRV